MTKDYISENKRRKKAYDKEGEFLKQVQKDERERGQRAPRQNEQSNIERAIEKTQGGKL